MGRQSPKFYCPKCGKKTLIATSHYDYNLSDWKRGYECKNQAPRRYNHLISAFANNHDPSGTLDDESNYWGYEARWSGSKQALRLAQQEEVKAYLKKNPTPCDCTIFVEGREAKISDYGCLLDKLIQTDPPIKVYLLENNVYVKKRGFEVLYSTEIMDVVRLNDDHGVAVWLYWKCKWEPDRQSSEIEWSDLTHEAAAYILHKGKTIQSIFRNHTRYPLWTKPDRKERATSLQNVPFCGSLGKRKKAEIVEWAKSLEKNLQDYQKQAAAAVEAWKAWGDQLRAAVSREIRVCISHYNGVSKTAYITINGALTQGQIERIAEALKEPESIDEIAARADRLIEQAEQLLSRDK